MPYIGPGSPSDPVPDSYEQTTGDLHNTATLAADRIDGISTRAYIENIATLIAALTKNRK